MATPIKIIVSFLLSAFLFAGVAFFVHTGFWEAIESRFYNLSVTRTLVRETARDAQILSEQLAGLQSRFERILHNTAVSRSFLTEQEPADIYERSMLFGLLQESVTGFQSAILVDPDGVKIHFSTEPQDVPNRDYDGNVPIQEQGQITLISDRAGGRIIFSLPVNDERGNYQGTALFTVSARFLTESLIAAGRTDAAENLVLCATSTGGATSAPAGIVSGLPGISGEEILAGVSAVWAKGYRSMVPFLSADVTLTLVSVRMEQGFYYGRIVNEAVFVFSPLLQILTLAAIFLTVFLIIFFLFSLRQRPTDAKRPKENQRPRDVQRPAAVRQEPAAGYEYKEEYLEELEKVQDTTHSPAIRGRGLLATAAQIAATSGRRASPGGQASDGHQTSDVICEQNGIPYISSNAFSRDAAIEEKLDTNFVQLIESVVNKTSSSSASRN